MKKTLVKILEFIEKHLYNFVYYNYFPFIIFTLFFIYSVSQIPSEDEILSMPDDKVFMNRYCFSSYSDDNFSENVHKLSMIKLDFRNNYVHKFSGDFFIDPNKPIEERTITYPSNLNSYDGINNFASAKDYKSITKDLVKFEELLAEKTSDERKEYLSELVLNQISPIGLEFFQESYLISNIRTTDNKNETDKKIYFQIVNKNLEVGKYIIKNENIYISDFVEINPTLLSPVGYFQNCYKFLPEGTGYPRGSLGF